MDILETITANMRREVAWQKQVLPSMRCPGSVRRVAPRRRAPRAARWRSRKRASSPSSNAAPRRKGWLHEDAVELPFRLTRPGGASACSVLTDGEFFGGTLE